MVAVLHLFSSAGAESVAFESCLAQQFACHCTHYTAKGHARYAKGRDGRTFAKLIILSPVLLALCMVV